MEPPRVWLWGTIQCAGPHDGVSNLEGHIIVDLPPFQPSAAPHRAQDRGGGGETDPGRHLREDTRKTSRSLGMHVISCVLGLLARAQAVERRVWRLHEA